MFFLQPSVGPGLTEASVTFLYHTQPWRDHFQNQYELYWLLTNAMFNWVVFRLYTLPGYIKSLKLVFRSSWKLHELDIDQGVIFRFSSVRTPFFSSSICDGCGWYFPSELVYSIYTNEISAIICHLFILLQICRSLSLLSGSPYNTSFFCWKTNKVYFPLTTTLPQFSQ